MHLAINKGALDANGIEEVLRRAVVQSLLPMDFNIPVIVMYDDPRLSMRIQGFKTVSGLARMIQHVFDHVSIFRGCLVIFDEETAYTYACFTTLTINEGEGEFIEEQFSSSAKAYFDGVHKAQGSI